MRLIIKILLPLNSFAGLWKIELKVKNAIELWQALENIVEQGYKINNGNRF